MLLLLLEVGTMSKIHTKRERLSIDVLSEEHRQLKASAALRGETIREYVIKSIKERLNMDAEGTELTILASRLNQDPILKTLWDNEKDAAYDKL